MADKHECNKWRTVCAAYGHAVLWCAEDDDGHFWAENGEYSNQVNFCPFCGEKAPTPAVEEERIAASR